MNRNCNPKGGNQSPMVLKLEEERIKRMSSVSKGFKYLFVGRLFHDLFSAKAMPDR